MLRTNERADIRRWVASRPKAKFFSSCDAQGRESFADRFFHKEPLDRQTDLAAIRVAAPHRGAGCDIEVGIGKNDHGVLTAQFENRWNQLLRTRLCNTPPSCHASREEDLVRSGLDQRLTYFPATLNN